MKQVDDIVQKLINNYKVRHCFLKSLQRENYNGIFCLDSYIQDNPYIISEKIFLELIKKAHKSKSVNNVFKEINAFIVFDYNITNKIFNELLDFAKKNDWIYLGLCHANLSEPRVSALKSLNLEESLWY